MHRVEIAGVLACHPGGRDKLMDKFNETYYHHGIKKHIEKYLRRCESCLTSNPLQTVTPPPPIPIRSCYPYQRIQLDVIHIATKKKRYMANNYWGFAFTLTIKCCFSKYTWLFPLVNKEAAGILHVIQFLFEKEGFPDIFHSDNGKEFVANIVKNFLKEKEISIRHGRPRHPQSQGQIENLNKLVKRHLNR